jgi:2-C-methyl-D-erythritol 4-phosphate cytidylyltransferase
MPTFAVVLPAAGQSSRFGPGEKKPFATLDGRAVWLRSAELFVNRKDVCQCVVVIAPDDRELFDIRYTANLAFMDVRVAPGGRERFESVANALVTAAAKDGAAILAVPVSDTVKRVGAGKKIEETLSRQGLWLAQTPQVFRRDWLEAAYARRGELGAAITDDAQLVEAAGHPVRVVEGAPTNLKITTAADLALAEAILKSRPKPKEKRPVHPFADEEMWR